jgi:hypothetical protein
MTRRPRARDASNLMVPNHVKACIRSGLGMVAQALPSSRPDSVSPLALVCYIRMRRAFQYLHSLFISMPPRIIPNKYEKLTYFILDNYNSLLECENCKKCWTQDGSAFMRDQAGSRNNMYYRHFRCKGKGKGTCSQSHSHEDFLALAIRQLAPDLIEQAKIQSGYSATLTSTVPKRVYDGTHSGLTPTYKRTSAAVHTIAPPDFSLPPPDFPDNRGHLHVLSLP